MKNLAFGWQRAWAAFALVAWAAAAGGAEITNLVGLVKDAEGRPLTNPGERQGERVGAEDVKVLVCGREAKLADGSWGRNHAPHCMMPRAWVDQTGHFRVPLWDPDVRFNLWVSKPGFAPTFVSVIPEGKEVAVTLKGGARVSGHVNHRVNGKLEPMKGASVYLQCARGDVAHQKLLFEDPYLTGVFVKEGDDRPYQEHQVSGDLGEYVFHVLPPPKDKKWFLICLDEIFPLDVKEGQTVKGPEFEVTVQAVEAEKKAPPFAASRE